MERIVEHRRSLRRRGHLYRTSDRFRSLYMVRTGLLKSYRLTPEGEELVIGFHLPGEMLGSDAIDEGAYPCSAVALESVSLCEIPFRRLGDLCRRLPGLPHRLLRLMSSQILAEEDRHRALLRRTAEERLAIFMLGFSARFSRQGLSPLRLRLSMPRRDLSNYLGLAPETVSRLFKRFRERGWISEQGKELVLRDVAALRRTAGLGYGATGRVSDIESPRTASHEWPHGRAAAVSSCGGSAVPMKCPAFGGRCAPESPLGVNMVSTEGACAAYYRYRRGAGGGDDALVAGHGPALGPQSARE